MIVSDSHKQDWEDLAADDPLWAIATDASKKNGRWNLEDFLQTGSTEAAKVIGHAAMLGLPHRFESCLDFGCGVGRVTRAFSSYFKHSLGVDISGKMLDMARTISPQCTFVNLADFPFPESRFDLVYSNIVLQHQPSRANALYYIGQFIKMLGPGGLAVFQLPTRIRFRNRIQPRRRVYRLFRAMGVSPETLLSCGLNPMRMIAVPERHVLKLIEQQNGKVLSIIPHSDSRVTGNDYFVGRI